MDIEVLGAGCKNCVALERTTSEALQRLGRDEKITKITDYGQIASYGVLSTPALAIDGVVKVIGRVPSIEEVMELVAAAGG
ncbi:MAG TPA: thioredoxin family protein [Acidimicrobiia bacterium]|nr:thioredoxin family protein [Acidimicrobiia bacterium]